MDTPKYGVGKWTDTINALLANAADPRLPVETQQAYAAKAAALMTKHGITDKQLNDARTTGTVADADANLWPYAVTNTHELGTARAVIVQKIAEAMGCKVSSQTNRPPNPIVVAIVGTPADLAALQTLVPLIARQAEYATMSEAAAGRRDITYLRGFLIGYGRAVAERITQRRSEIIRDTPGADLVLASRARHIHDTFHQLLGAYLGKGRAVEHVDGAGLAAGQAAGRRADLGDNPVATTGPRTITH